MRKQKNDMMLLGIGLMMKIQYLLVIHPKYIHKVLLPMELLLNRWAMKIMM
jgi:hypothetical protein